MKLTERVPVGQEAARTSGSLAVVLGCWSAATVVLAVLLAGARELEQPSAVNGAVSMALLLATTWALRRWLEPVPIEAIRAAPRTRRRAYALVLVAAAAYLTAQGVWFL